MDISGCMYRAERVAPREKLSADTAKSPVGADAARTESAYDASKTYKGYVEACLRDKGYEVVGWD